MSRTRLALALLGPLLFGSLACQAKPHGQRSHALDGPASHTRRDLDLSPEQAAYLADLAAAADAHPDDFAALEASGLAHLNFTLAGVLRLRDRAEQDLEAAFALNPNDAQLNRTLGRFYNLRAVDGDNSKAEMQVRVYSALLGDEHPMAMDDARFVAYSFLMLGRILVDKNGGHNLDALRKVGQLEQQLAARVQAQPDNVEFRALAGNFAYFFAGNIPLERERRVREAVAYFEVVRARWDELRAGARDPLHCPNTRENFMFELAEGLMVLERGAEARPIYEELTAITSPRTRAKELIAHVAGERLRNFDRYLGEMQLMPPWPSDVSNCVVCHAWSAEVGLESLYAVEPIRLDDVPSRAQLQPIPTMLNMDAAPVQLRGRERLPGELAALIEGRCGPCHFAGGEAVELLDLRDATSVEAHAENIGVRVEAGEMPPDGGLSAEQRELVSGWVAGLAAADERP